MWSQSLLRRTSAALAAVWLTATSALAPVFACEAHGGTGHHGATAGAVGHHVGAADHSSSREDGAPAATAHGESHYHGHGHSHAVPAVSPAAADTDVVPLAHHDHDAHASPSTQVGTAHCAPAAETGSPDDSAPCTCAGSCCPQATVATPGIAPVLTHAVVSATPTITPSSHRPASPDAAPRRIQPPATAPPVHTPA